MAKQKTANTLNETMKKTFETCAGDVHPRGAWSSTDHRVAIEDVIYGVGVTTLTSKNRIVTTDDPNQGPGIKAVGLTTDALAELDTYLKDLYEDPILQSKLRGLDLRHKIDTIRDTIISYIDDLRVRCKHLVKMELDEYIKGLVANIDADIDSVLKLVGEKGIGTYVKKQQSKIAAIISKGISSIKKIPEITEKIPTWAGSAMNLSMFAFLFHGSREFFGKLPVLLGPCPLKHADYIEVARSGKVLKFRATGSVFLAKQEGGDQSDAIKIEGKLYKKEFGFMFLLWALFLYGQSKFKDMKSIKSMTVTDISQVRKINDLLMTDNSLQKPSYEFHRTFPFVNRHFIIPNCYIETISIEDKLPLKDTIRYSILLRTYTKPQRIVKYVVNKEEGTTVYGFKKKTMMTEMVEFSLNIGWRMLNASGWLIDDQEWKIGSANDEGALDTYYDVDWSSLTTVTYLSLMGAVV